MSGCVIGPLDVESKSETVNVASRPVGFVQIPDQLLVNLLILDPAEMDPGGQVTVGGVRAAHLVEVLKVTPGQTVRVGLLDGARGTATVAAIAPARVSLHCCFEPAAPPRPRVDLLLALPRPKVMRRLWAQLAALGVGRVILTNAARVERPYFDAHVISPECYGPLLVEGLQQARDTRLPQVSIHRRFRVLVEDELDQLAGASLRLVAHPGAATTIRQAVRANGDGRVLLAVGPEGGWNAFEVALLEAHGFQIVGMGERALRVDTACIALLAMVHGTLRDSA
jgi:16S rRNA (uracil1498-N3)-methyltransferase